MACLGVQASIGSVPLNLRESDARNEVHFDVEVDRASRVDLLGRRHDGLRSIETLALFSVRFGPSMRGVSDALALMTGLSEHEAAAE